MTVIATSHFNLALTRRRMQTAFIAQDWDNVKHWDRLLTQQLNDAFEDPARDNELLVRELEKVLGLYAEMVECLPAGADEQWLTPEMR